MGTPIYSNQAAGIFGSNGQSNLLGSLGALGSAPIGALGSAPTSNSYQQMSNQAIAQIQAMTQQWNQLQRPNWVFNGEPMSIGEFAAAIWPEDCADKSFFLLKFTKESE